MYFKIQASSDFRKVKRCEYIILRNTPSRVWGSETYEYSYCAINEDYKEYCSLIRHCSHKLLNEALLSTVFCLTQSHKITKKATKKNQRTVQARLTGMDAELRVTPHICIMSGLGQTSGFQNLSGFGIPDKGVWTCNPRFCSRMTLNYIQLLTAP